MSEDCANELDGLQDRIGYHFRDRALLVQALTHRSYCNEHPDASCDNERFEFLGDALLDCTIARVLCERYATAGEGDLTRYRAMLVSEKGLAAVAREIGLGECLRLGRGEDRSGGRERPRLLASAFEAVVAAVYFDAGHARVDELIERLFAHRIDELPDECKSWDCKTWVQERIQAVLRRVPHYTVVRSTGPEHSRHYVVALDVEGRHLAQGEGNSWREATRQAALALARRFRREGVENVLREAGVLPEDAGEGTSKHADTEGIDS